MTAASADELRPVQLQRFPLEVWARAHEHFEGLKREFALVAMSGDGSDVPRRLLDLIDALMNEYGSVSAGPDQVRDEAMDRGETEVELVYMIPARAREAVLAAAALLEEADEFCRQGQHLLSLATPTEAVVFRRWYFGEFYAQLNGEPPLAWPDADHERIAADPHLRGQGE